MKELNMNIKLKAVKLFLCGDAYDDIVQKLGIAKGSVVNIIDDFREGFLPVPPGMTEYLDEMRHLVVDLKKHNTTVSQLKNYVKLHVKLLEMGVDAEETEQWLDICQGIASPTVSNNQFVAAALELAKVTLENGISYELLVQDYNEKLKLSETLEATIHQKKEELAKLKQECKEEKEQATKGLDSITKAMATAQDNFAKQKKQVKAELDQYLAQNKLEWQEVGTAVALLNTGLSGAGLTHIEIGKLSDMIAAVGSLQVCVKQLGQERDNLKDEAEKLVQDKDNHAKIVSELKALKDDLLGATAKAGQDYFELNTQMESERAKLAELEQIVSGCIDDIYNTHLVMGLLLSPESLSESDIDSLIKLIIYSKQYRNGIDVQKLKYENGDVLCECKIPRLYVNPEKHDVDIDEARKKLAICLVPLVESQFMPKWEWQSDQLNQIILQLHGLEQSLEDLSWLH